MRIRKNKKLSPLIYPQGETVHICRLNQSTWDVTPLPEEAYQNTQFEYEDSFDRNGSIGDSIDVVESVAFMKVGDDNFVDDNDDDIAIEIAKQLEESNQEALLKSFNSKEPEHCDNRLTGGRRAGRIRATKKGPSSASISNEFYYYSGFGPSKGRRRGGGGGDNEVEIDNNNGSVITAQNNSMVLSSSIFDNNEEFDYVNDDDDDDDDVEEDDENGIGDSGKKRMRKPIKERSLKSLM